MAPETLWRSQHEDSRSITWPSTQCKKSWASHLDAELGHRLLGVHTELYLWVPGYGMWMAEPCHLPRKWLCPPLMFGVKPWDTTTSGKDPWKLVLKWISYWITCKFAFKGLLKPTTDILPRSVQTSTTTHFELQCQFLQTHVPRKDIALPLEELPFQNQTKIMYL